VLFTGEAIYFRGIFNSLIHIFCILLLVAHPKQSCELIHFINDIKKGGLFVIGHVKIGALDDYELDPVQTEYSQWMSLIDNLKVKAFLVMKRISFFFSYFSSENQQVLHHHKTLSIQYWVSFRPTQISLTDVKNLPRQYLPKLAQQRLLL
jgi:hypothetical protein